MKKISDFKDDEKAALQQSVNFQAKRIIDTDYEDAYNTIEDDYGLCSDCKEFKLTKMEFGDIYAECREWDKMRNSQRRVVECSAYNKRGAMTLWDMQNLAYIIDVEDKKVGLI